MATNDRQSRPNEAAQVKATDAAKELAKENGVDLGAVKPSGAEGSVTKTDVEEVIAKQQEAAAANEAAQAAALAESGALEEARMFEARLNPELPGSAPDSIRIGDKVYSNGTPITQEEADGLKQFKSGPSAEHPGGVVYVLKGKEITA